MSVLISLSILYCLSLLAPASYSTTDHDSFIANHAIYIAVIELIHQPNHDKAELRVKTFTDDLQDVLKNKFGRSFFLPDELIEGDDFDKVAAYFSDHLKFVVNEQRAGYELNKVTRENDAHWLYFTLKAPRNWQKLEIKADFLMELFPQQSNIFQLKVGKKKLFYRLTIDHKSQTITFSD